MWSLSRERENAPQHYYYSWSMLLLRRFALPRGRRDPPLCRALALEDSRVLCLAVALWLSARRRGTEVILPANHGPRWPQPNAAGGKLAHPGARGEAGPGGLFAWVLQARGVSTAKSPGRAGQGRARQSKAKQRFKKRGSWRKSWDLACRHNRERPYWKGGGGNPSIA